jgi:two-component system, NtrC family, nitrogen regulation sensor histidine kinase GlnL
MRFEPTTDALSTPVAWADADGLIRGVNPAFARWLGVSSRRLLGQPLAALEIEGDAMARFLDNTDRDVLRLHRMALGMPPASRRVSPRAGCPAWMAGGGCWKRIRWTNSPRSIPPRSCPTP